MRSSLRILYSLAKIHVSSRRLKTAALSSRVKWRSYLLYNKPNLPSGPARFFLSARFFQTQAKIEKEENLQGQKRRTARSPAGKNSLRKVAIEAQRSQDKRLGKVATSEGQITTKTITAFCAAEQYDMDHVDRILNVLGQDRDPYGIELYPQVLHLEIPVDSSIAINDDRTQTRGDIFVFPSGTVVAWGVSRNTVAKLVTEKLLPAALRPHLEQLEEEDLEFVEDLSKETSSIKGDTITIGTKLRTPPHDAVTVESQFEGKLTVRDAKIESELSHNRKRDTLLAKVAFSSGLARSTKLAVLERLLRDYHESTKPFVQMLASGGHLPRSRGAILAKTGQLLNIRAQLNLYSELTDSLPDLFWDSRSELGLEGHYDHVGRALDTNIRVKELNEKMNYAQEIANVLREALNERHGARLESIIIFLIAVEIGFNILHEYRYRQEKGAKKLVQDADGLA